MQMKEYLADTFKFNDRANKRMIEKIASLPDKAEGIKYISHLINSQKKWLARIKEYPNDPKLDWWEPIYSYEQLFTEWTDSLNAWLEFLNARSEDDLFKEVNYIGFDGGIWSTELKNIPLQLNYHSIHHRAQLQTIIRSQGLEPDFIDFIGTVARKIS